MNAILVGIDIIVMMIRGEEEYNIFTKYLEGKKQILCFATVAEIELWFTMEKENLPSDGLTKWNEFKGQCEVIHTSSGSITRAAQLASHWGKGFRKHWSDIWIAATALELGIPLATNNVKDFKKFEALGLMILFPWT